MVIFKVITILILIIVFIFPAQGLAAIENLDEMFNRKQRIGSAVYPMNQLENAVNNYIWQPETFMYNDTTSGAEVWRVSNTPNLSNYYHNDIGMSPWSADGKRFGFVSSRSTSAFGKTSSNIWMIADTDGKFLRPATGASGRGYSSNRSYMHWSPQIPDLYYEFGESGGNGLSLKSSDLYENRVSDTGITKNLILSLPTGQNKIDKMISGDGRKILASPNDESTIYPLTVYPIPNLDDPDGYGISRNVAPYGSTFTPYSAAHDRYYAGDGAWYFIMASGGWTSWWRLMTLGSASDGGALCNNADYPVVDINYDFGECWPDNAATAPDPSPLSPNYWSHFVPDRWGRLALHTAQNDDNPATYGTSVWDMQKHKYIIKSLGANSQHHDWHGFTDWTVSSADTPYSNQKLYIQKYNDSNSQIMVNKTYTRYNGGSAYETLPRPAQSPDGTKVAWNSEFFNGGSNNVDIFWSVAYYPYPPTDLSATYNNGVMIKWFPPKYTERGWPYVSSNPQKDSLGWPLLDANGNEIGEPLYAREIKKYHIWRSSSQTGPWQEVGSTNADYSDTYAEDSNMFMLHPVVSGLKVSPTNKISFTDNPSDGTFYYAITSEEHSGLESDKLSEIIRITKSSSNISSQIVASQGQNNFWRRLPQMPTAFSYTAQATAGHYRLNWTEPQDSKIRYYNIYYNNAGVPQIDQKFRIASVSVGVSTYIDWLADISAPGYYLITSVDRYGNESSSDTIPPSSPTGLVVQ